MRRRANTSGSPVRFKKEPPGAAARKVKQGGVKQSGQEPLDVQKWTPAMMDPIS
jgi:hypothetical protein